MKTKTEFSVKEKLDPGNWNQKNQKYTGSKIRTKYIETMIEMYSCSLKTAALIGGYTSAKELVNSIKNKPQDQSITITKSIRNFINHRKGFMRAGTIRNYEVRLRNLEAYIEFRKMEFTNLNFDLVEAERYINWFCNRANTNNKATANRNVLFFRASLIQAQKSGLIKELALQNFTRQSDPKKQNIVLNINEFNAIKKKNFQSIILTRVRDLFIFQCLTGLSYCDLWNDWEIRKTDSGKILTGNRRKNNQKFFVPISENAIDILKKYKYQLPEYDNAVYNRILKEIAAICCIQKRITTHTARKTFATLKDGEGWTRETVSKMLGHRSIKTTENYYLAESSQRLENEMMNRRKLRV